MDLIEKQNLCKALEKSKQEYLLYQKATCYKNYDEFLSVLNSLHLTEQWFKILDKDRVSLFKIKYTPGPVITYSVVISKNLKVETYLYGTEVTILENKIKTPFTTNNLQELKDLLEKIDSCESGNSCTAPVDHIANDDMGKNKLLKQTDDRLKEILSHILGIMEPFIKDGYTGLQFIFEQLKLYTSCKERYRYSADTMILSSIVYSISPHAYRFLRHSDFLVLPHPESIKAVCNKLLTDPTSEDRQLLLTYAKNIYKYLDDHEKNVILLMDEIHIQPYLDYKGGNIVGTAYNNNSLATSAYVFMISSIMSDFKEVVHICPTSKTDHNMLYIFMKYLITSLEEIGYRIFCVVSDNNTINSKAMSRFSKDNKLSIVYPHSVDNKRPLFYLFDSVHLLKCIRNNWLNSKPDQPLTFPDFETGTEKLANFQALKRLHELEYDKLLKYGYSLSLKALFPSALKRQNVKLALKIFNPYVIQALLQFDTNINLSKDTADFINIILTWWKIVNVKTPHKGQRLNDIYQQPVVARNPSDPKLEFLNKMLNWLDVWKSGKFSHRLTSQTHNALSHTVYGMIEITKFCFEELNMKYILYGKFQTDLLENRFGKYRQLAGGQYNISVRQLYESEKKA